MANTTKSIKTRIQNKHDLEVNWLKASNFVPLKGEIIIYDQEIDPSTGRAFTELVDGETITLLPEGRTTPYSYARIKLGDGNTIVSDLPFFASVAIENLEATVATIQNQLNTHNHNIDWNNNTSTSSGYISNKPFIKKGSTDTSIVIGTGEAVGEYSVAGGTNDKNLVSDLMGNNVLASLLTSIDAPKASGNMSLSFGAGTKTYTAGSVSLGANTEAGCLGFYWYNIEFSTEENNTSATITLSTTQHSYPIFGSSLKERTWSGTNAPASLKKWAIGDKITIVNNIKYGEAASITAIEVDSSGNPTGKITVDKLPFTSGDVTVSKTAAAKYLFDDCAVYVPEKPTAGINQFALGAVAIGLENKAAGSFSMATGWKTKTVTDFAHAEGIETVAGYAAHSEGYQTQATGKMSHAENANTIASGYATHAEGEGTVASGSEAHAEGGGSKATAWCSHAEGHLTNALNSKAHAEGESTNATGENSHAEGETTVASGKDSHAEGYNTQALSTASHAEGHTTEAKYVAHAEGGNTKAYGNYSHAEGNGSTTGKSTGTKASSAHAEGKNTVADGVAAHSEGEETQAIGNDSHAEGYNTRALSKAAHAEGSDTIAEGVNSHSQGNKTYVKGENAHIEGLSTNKLDQIVTMTNERSIFDAVTSYWATDKFSYAYGNASHTEGKNNITWGAQSHAEGENNIAIGSNAHAEGYNNKATGYHSHVEGYTTEAGYCAHAEGLNSKALGNQSHAEGKECTVLASAASAHAEGVKTIAEKDASHAEGNNTIAKGFNAHAEGNSAIAEGNSSHAEGEATHAMKTWSHAEGKDTVADGYAAHTEGLGTKAVKDYTHVQGKYNEVDTNTDNTYVHIVGWGDSDTSRRNIHTLDKDGNAYFAGNVNANELNVKKVKASTAAFSESVETKDIKLNNKSLNETINEINTNTSKGLNNLNTELTEKIDSKISETTSIINTGLASHNTRLTNTEETLANLKEYSGIIDVEDILSVENPIDRAIYRMPLYYLIINGRFYDYATVYRNVISDPLPSTGAVFRKDYINSIGDTVDWYNVYHNSAYNDYFGYTTEYGWTPLEVLVTEYNFFGEGYTYEGEFTNPVLIPTENTVAILKTSALYTISYGKINRLITNRATAYFAESYNSIDNKATGYFSHAEGIRSESSGWASHAEGDGTKAAGPEAHTEGGGTQANGWCSHAEGYFTVANGTRQHVQGKYNIIDNSHKYAHIVGNGTGEDITDENGNVIEQNRSNAHTLDWYGNAWYQKSVSIGRSKLEYDEVHNRIVISFK